MSKALTPRYEVQLADGVVVIERDEMQTLAYLLREVSGQPGWDRVAVAWDKAVKGQPPWQFNRKIQNATLQLLAEAVRWARETKQPRRARVEALYRKFDFNTGLGRAAQREKENSRG